MKQLKVGLTDQIRDELDRAAKKRGLSTSEEARFRLEASLQLDHYDPAVLEIAAHVRELANSVAIYENSGLRASPDWQNDPVLVEALKQAIEAWFSLVAPQHAEGGGAGRGIDPVTLGRSIALSQYRYLIERLKVDRDMGDLRKSMLDEPAFQYSDSRGERGTMTFRQMDEAYAKLSDKEKLQLREEAEAQLDADYRRDFGRSRPKRG